MTFKKTKIQIKATSLLSSKASHILLYGGSRSGKTFLLVYAVIVRALKEKSRHIILRKNLNSAKRSIWRDTLPKVMDIAFKGLKPLSNYNESDLFIKLPNGSEIWVSGLDDKERVEKILGNEYSTIYLNEASQIPYASISILVTRIAEKNKLVKKVYYDENPPSKRHWTYKLFIQHKNPITDMPIDDNNYASMLMNPKDNLDNLDENYLKELNNLPARDRKRFLEGKFTDDREGGLFKYEWIKRQHEGTKYDRIVVAIDPAVSTNVGSDETGIVVVARKGDFGYVLEDSTGKYTPDQWGKKAVELYKKYNANMIIGEVNNGGDMIKNTLRHIDNNVPFKAVRATKGKFLRAEPIATLYEQGRIYHYGIFEELEDQMLDMKVDFDKKEMGYSPDRLDAMVWGFSHLFNTDSGRMVFTVLGR